MPSVETVITGPLVTGRGLVIARFRTYFVGILERPARRVTTSRSPQSTTMEVRAMSEQQGDEVAQEHGELIAELEERDDVETQEQTVGTLRKMFDEDELEEIPSDEIVKTSGLLSHVEEDGETLGHVLMIEWDDVEDVMGPIRTADRLPGVSVLLRDVLGHGLTNLI